MSRHEKIFRQDEANIPLFKNHDEAKAWFKNRYKNSFVLTNFSVINEKKCYFYTLVLDPEVYNDGVKKLESAKTLLGFEFLYSYQSIEIYEDGNIHIVHQPFLP
ncbi:hypothetical protein [Bacillus velezensis]|uniref:hypothetical protein n=1 Tax=Bacillus velezensis TaxID=492670 RepID=UPI001A921192|nr:hypothetical protein [Bacillus velezensis]BCT30471.1 hypothetical protein BVAD3_41450 [Bacillus velezensis]